MGSSVQPVPTSTPPVAPSDPVSAYLAKYGKGNSPVPTGNDPVSRYLAKYGKQGIPNPGVSDATDTSHPLPAPAGNAGDVAINAATLGLHPVLYGAGEALKQLVTGHGTAAAGQAFTKGRQEVGQSISDAERTKPQESGFATALGTATPFAAEGPIEALASRMGIAGEAAPAAATLGGRVLQSAGRGAITGGAYNAINSEGTPKNRVLETLMGALAGGAMGGAAPLVTGAAAKIGSAVSHGFTPIATQASRAADEQIAHAIQSDGGVESVLGNARKDYGLTPAGTPQMLATSAGPEVNNAVSRATSIPSQSGFDLAQKINDAKAGEAAAIKKAMGNSSGVTQTTVAPDGSVGPDVTPSAYQATKTIDRQQSVSAHTLYPNAFNERAPYTTDPTSINARDWYHGSGTANLTREALDPLATKENNLFGPGVYMTDDPNVAASYASKRGAGGNAPTLYQAKLNIRKPLDMDAMAPPNVQGVFAHAADQMDKSFDDDAATEAMAAALKIPGATSTDLYKALQSAASTYSRDHNIPPYEFGDTFDALHRDLGNVGYDALTYKGGARTGNAVHQVVIPFAPNSERSVPSFGAMASGSDVSVPRRVPTQPRMVTDPEIINTIRSNPDLSAALGSAVNIAKRNGFAVENPLTFALPPDADPTQAFMEHMAKQFGTTPEGAANIIKMDPSVVEKYAAQAIPRSSIPLAVINHMKQGADDVIAQRLATDKTFTRESGRQLQADVQSVIQKVDAQHPEFANARMVFANDAQRKDAIAAGESAINKGLPSEQVSDEMSGLKAPNDDKPGLARPVATQNVPDYKTGAVSAYSDKIDALSPQSSVAKLFQSPDDLNRVHAILGDDGMQSFNDALDYGNRVEATAGRVASNPSSQMDAVKARFGPGSTPPAGGSVRYSMVRALRNMSAKRQAAFESALGETLAKRLALDPTGQEGAQFFQKVSGILDSQSAAKVAARAQIKARTMRATAGFAGLLGAKVDNATNQPQPR